MLLPKRGGRIVAGDAVSYYVYLRSAVFDRDLDFENDYLHLYGLAADDPKKWTFFRETPTGHVTNPMSVGPAILWAPFFLATCLGVWVADVFGAAIPLDGYGWIFQLSAGYSGVILATLGCFLSWRLAAIWFPERTALGATLALWAGSSAIYYSLVSPTYSHSASLFAVALLLLYWARTRERVSPRRDFVVGLLGGLASLVRWQDAVFLLFPAHDILLGIGRSRARGASWGEALSTAAARAVTCSIGAALAFSPQMLAWSVIYGTPLTIPQGAEWMQWGSPHVLEVLFSDWQGLVSWTPVVGLALAGLWWLRRRDPEAAAAFALAFLATLYVNASVSQWWAGTAFGARRFTSCFPILAVGLAAAADRFPKPAARAAVLGLVALNLLLLLQYELHMHGLEEIAPYPRGFFDLWIARFLVPLRALMLFWQRA